MKFSCFGATPVCLGFTPGIISGRLGTYGVWGIKTHVTIYKTRDPQRHYAFKIHVNQYDFNLKEEKKTTCEKKEKCLNILIVIV